METATRQRKCPNCFSDYNGTSPCCPFCGYDYASQDGQYPLALAPERILAGRYILGRVLGQGGFGITYLAWSVRDKTRVAIKEFFPENLVTRRSGSTQVSLLAADREESFRFGKEQFLAEAKTLAQFTQNPNIVGVHSYFEENNTAYFTMEYVEGKSLKSFLQEKGGKLSWEETVQVLMPVMDALEAVHAKGIIHRDVKPENIFITQDGHTKLLDFGSARYSLGDKSRSLDVVLTAGYAPKEQYARHGRQGPYTDIYSLAACFYACITGLVPTESVERVENDDLPLPSARGAKLPKEAEDAILKGLNLRAEDRWQTITEFKRNLLQTAPTPDDPKPDDPGGDDPGGNSGDTERPEVVVHPGKRDKKRTLSLKEKRTRWIVAAIIGIGLCGIGIFWVMPIEVKDKSIQAKGKEIGSYTGQTRGGKPSGNGRMEYKEGGIYDGNWVNGQRSGQGSMSYANADMYIGEWAQDKENGTGTMTYSSGDVYEGEWKDGQRDGEGVLTAADGIRSYEGTWAENEMNGEILMTLSFNKETNWVSTLQLNYENGTPVGEGIYTAVSGKSITAEWEYVENIEMENGALYTGLMVENIPSGYGKVTYEDESSYIGEFSDGLRSGVGYLQEEDDSYYLGEWAEDMRSGYGYYHYYDGSVFEGVWSEDIPAGQGSYTYANGDTVKGEWSYVEGEEVHALYTDNYAPDVFYYGLIMDNQPCGYGILEFEFEGTAEDHLSYYLGEIQNGVPQGKGIYWFENGDVLEGEWRVQATSTYSSLVLNGKANGVGLVELGDGVYWGEYKNGSQNGYGIYLYDSGNWYAGEWSENERSGYGIFQWESGDRYEGVWQDGERTGQGSYYWPNGDRYEGMWVKGRQTGEGTYYYADGGELTGTWENGELVG